jgi:ATP-dependent protease HslVU (ClpYQ) peptidase subunit
LTVIVGLAHKGRVYLGADSVATTGWHSRIHLVEPKVWQQGGCVFGLTGSTREQQIIEHRLQVPERKADVDVLRWLAVDFVDALRQARKDSGHDEKLTTGPEVGCHFMMGVGGRLFILYDSYAFVEQPHGYAIGSGGELAIGSLHTSRLFMKQPEKRIEAALQAACYNNNTCAPPFTYVSI